MSWGGQPYPEMNTWYGYIYNSSTELNGQFYWMFYFMQTYSSAPLFTCQSNTTGKDSVKTRWDRATNIVRIKAIKIGQKEQAYTRWYQSSTEASQYKIYKWIYYSSVSVPNQTIAHEKYFTKESDRLYQVPYVRINKAIKIYDKIRSDMDHKWGYKTSNEKNYVLFFNVNWSQGAIKSSITSDNSDSKKDTKPHQYYMYPLRALVCYF